MKKVKLKELMPLMEFINGSYDGDTARLSNDINKAIYLLHRVKKDEVPEDAVEDVSFTLYEISQKLFKSYLKE